MEERTQAPTWRELTVAVVGGAGLALAAMAAAAFGAGSPVCRVYNRLPDGSINIGSGTLVDATADGSQGLVLSCAHLFTEGVGQVMVEFLDGRTHGVRVDAVDRAADLSALSIAHPRESPAAVSFELASSALLTACGFGPSGEYRCIAGSVVGAAEGPGQVSVQMAGAVRSGDSGGGVFDEQGRLVAVIWGEASGVTYASCGVPLARFVEGVLGGRQTAAYAPACTMPGGCPTGQCPLVSRPVVSGPSFSASPQASAPVQQQSPVVANGASAQQLAEVTRRIDELEQKKQDRGNYLLRSELKGYARADTLTSLETENSRRHQSLVSRLDKLAPVAGAAGRVAGALATTALGVSGPIGWGIVAGTSIGGWLVGRWLYMRERGVGCRRCATFPE